jgi:hypothetical protein
MSGSLMEIALLCALRKLRFGLSINVSGLT